MSRRTSAENQKLISQNLARTNEIMAKLSMLGSGIEDAPPFTDAERSHIAFCIGAVWMEMASRLEGDIEK